MVIYVVISVKLNQNFLKVMKTQCRNTYIFFEPFWKSFLILCPHIFDPGTRFLLDHLDLEDSTQSKEKTI